MNNENLTRFLHEELQFLKTITCHSFSMTKSAGGHPAILIELREGSKPLVFQEIVILEKYNQWLSKITAELREEKLKELDI